MKCHDGEECTLGCTEDRMQCAVPVSIVEELRMGFPIYPERAAVIADYVEKLEADLAAAQKELAAYKNAYEKAIFEWRDYGYKDCKNDNQTLDWIEYRVRELLAQEGVVVAMTTPNVISNAPPTAQPQYREPTIEDVIELRNCNLWGAPKWLDALKQLGFYRKVQP